MSLTIRMSKTVASSTMALLLCSLTACKIDEQEAVTVVVYRSTQQCTVKEKPVDCAQVGTYLRDTLKLKPERQIAVSFTGSDPGSKEDPILDTVASIVRAAGFKDVRAIRFGFE